MRFTIHRIDEQLDNAGIIIQQKVPNSKEKKSWQT